MADSSRDELSRQAEKHLRQGRTDLAIEVYERLAQLTPTDWNTVKQLADLHERAGQREAAAGRFLQCADHYFQEGFHPKAAALYRKVLKLEPQSEHAWCQLADVSLQLKLKVDARQALSQVLTLRQRRGDADGVRALEARLVELEPDDVRGRQATAVAAAAPPVESEAAPPPPPTAEDVSGRLRTLARDAEAAGDVEGAYRAWSAVLHRQPDDRALRLRLAYAAIDQRDFDVAVALVEPFDQQADAVAARFAVAQRTSRVDLLQATIARVTGWQSGGADLVHEVRDHLRGYDASLGDLWCGLAVDAFVQQGRATSATALIESAEARHPLPPDCHLRWVELCVDAGIEGLDRAQHALASSYVRTGRPDLARAVVEDLLLRRPDAGDVQTLARHVFEACGDIDPDRCVLALLTSAPPGDVEESTRVPSEDDLDAAVTDEPPADESDPPAREFFVTPPLPVQGDAANAGTSMDALVGTPTEASNQVPAPPASPAFDWAGLLGRELLPPPVPAPEVPRHAGAEAVTIEVLSLPLHSAPEEGAAATPDVPVPADDDGEAAHLDGDPAMGAAWIATDDVAATDAVDVEIDLTHLVEELSRQAPPSLPDARGTSVRVAEVPSADDAQEPGAEVAGDEVPEDAARGLAAQQVAAGRVFAAAGLASEAARAFERATRDVRTRFEAAEALADLHRSRGQLSEATRWYEEAAHAPVPDAAIRRPVLYDLAETLEAVGQPERALAVLLDLLSEVEDYRDARTKADRLLRVDAGG